MTDKGREALNAEDDDNPIYSISEDDFQHFPDEIRSQLETLAEDGRTVLQSVDREIDRAGRLMQARVDLSGLRHIRDRLDEYRFSYDFKAILENDMLTTAFVVTYARIHQSHAGKFSKNELPEHLRPIHDEIMELRNKRFAHADDHSSVTLSMRVTVEGDRFEMVPGMNITFAVGGRNEWRELVEVVDDILARRSDRLLEGLSRKTGKEWAFAQPPEGAERI